MCLTVLIKKLPFTVAIDPNIAIQPQNLATPQSTRIIFVQCLTVNDGVLKELSQCSAAPELFRKRWIINLETIVHTHCIPFLRLSRRRCQ